jgi:hypothetical protein
MFNLNVSKLIKVRSITFGFDIMLNYHLSKNLKLIGKDKFNYLIIIGPTYEIFNLNEI